MPTAHALDDPWIARMPDGTLKQRNPLTGTEVWTVPGRGRRPVPAAVADPRPVSTIQARRLCAFCQDRLLDTPPEKARILADGTILRGLLPHDLASTLPLARRVPNLFEILSYDYWAAGHGYVMPDATRARMDAYLADPAGRVHLRAICRAKALASGHDATAWDALPEAERLAAAPGFFAGGHDVIVARRHLVDGATDTGALASSGTLTPDEHAGFVDLTVDAMRDLYAANPAVAHVAAFQNWLRPAGASFDHLHKQVVAIDELGRQTAAEVEAVRADAEVFERVGPGLAEQRGLVIARTDHAVAFAGVGHRYPTVEVMSLVPGRPWEQTPEQRRGLADLLHLVHAATGPDVPCNEEWHHQPLSVDQAMPWRVLVKWRVSTLAGFEGGTQIYVNTLTPWDVRERVLTGAQGLLAEGCLGDGIRLEQD